MSFWSFRKKERLDEFRLISFFKENFTKESASCQHFVDFDHGMLDHRLKSPDSNVEVHEHKEICGY